MQIGLCKALKRLRFRALASLQLIKARPAKEKNIHVNIEPHTAYFKVGLYDKQ